MLLLVDCKVLTTCLFLYEGLTPERHAWFSQGWEGRMGQSNWYGMHCSMYKGYILTNLLLLHLVSSRCLTERYLIKSILFLCHAAFALNGVVQSCVTWQGIYKCLCQSAIRQCPMRESGGCLVFECVHCQSEMALISSESRGASRMRAGQGIWILRQGILGHFRPSGRIFGANGLFKDTFPFEGRGCIPLLPPPRCAPA